MVPVEQYEQWRREREAFFEAVEAIRGENADVSAEQVAAVGRAARQR